VVLPAASFAEKEGTFSNTERRVQRVRKAVDPPGEARADWEIISGIATRMGYRMEYAGAEAIFDEMRKVTPSYAGMTFERLDKGGLQWPCPTEDHPGTKILHREKFTRGKGKFHAIEHIPPAEPTDWEYPFLLTTGRILYHYHTGSMTRRSEALNACAPECFVEINPRDAASLGLEDGQLVKVTSRRGTLTAKALVGETTEAGTVFIPMHYFEAAVNNLTIAALDPQAKIPEYKVCAVRLEKAA
jgi:predicted molibdopterin-dependent oxidoreductase YjgC